MRYILLIFFYTLCSSITIAASMFESGNYSGNWKQMTNINSSVYNRQYSSSNYSTAAWYANNKKQQSINNTKSYSAKNYIETTATPFRYNTLDYSRSRQVKGGHGESYSARCHDIGDVSFCR